MAQLTYRRDPYWDIVKFFAMFMVVVGHVGSWGRPRGELSLMSNFIVAFNMPLFYLVSGYFSRKVFDQHDGKRLFKHLIRYFWPLGSFAIIVTLLRYFFLWDFPWTWIPRRIVSYVWGEGWFFYTLAWCEVITFAIYYLADRRKWRWMLLGGVMVVLLMFPIGVWNVDRIIMMLPFFWLGASPSFGLIKRIVDGKFWGLLICIIFGALLVLEGNCAYNGMSFYHSRFNAYDFSWFQLAAVFLRFGMGVLGVVSVMWALQTLLRIVPALHYGSILGMKTLGVYYVHFIIIAFVSKYGFLSESQFGWIIAASVIYLTSHCFVVLSQWHHVVRFAIWGDPDVVAERCVQVWRKLWK